MNAFVAAGFAVMTFSVRGYAKSELNHDAFGVQTEQAIEDLGAVMDWLRAQGVQKRDRWAGHGAAASPGAMSKTTPTGWAAW